MGEKHGKTTQEVIGTGSVIGKKNNCSEDLTFVIKKKKKAQRRASSQKRSRQTAFRGKKKKKDDLVFKARSLKMITASTVLPFCQ